MFSSKLALAQDQPASKSMDTTKLIHTEGSWSSENQVTILCPGRRTRDSRRRRLSRPMNRRSPRVVSSGSRPLRASVGGPQLPARSHADQQQADTHKKIATGSVHAIHDSSNITLSPSRSPSRCSDGRTRSPGRRARSSDAGGGQRSPVHAGGRDGARHRRRDRLWRRPTSA